MKVMITKIQHSSDFTLRHHMLKDEKPSYNSGLNLAPKIITHADADSKGGGRHNDQALMQIPFGVRKYKPKDNYTELNLPVIKT